MKKRLIAIAISILFIGIIACLFLFNDSHSDRNNNFTENTTENTCAHSYAEVITDPTCTEKGYTTYICSCGDKYTGKETAAFGHSWSQWKTINEPTVDDEGAAERSCLTCQKKETKKLAQQFTAIFLTKR